MERIQILGALAGCGLLTACVVERTVTDESGRVIYQEPAIETPFESNGEKLEEVMEQERELGW